MGGDVGSRVADGVEETVRGELLWQGVQVGYLGVEVDEVLAVVEKDLQTDVRLGLGSGEAGFCRTWNKETRSSHSTSEYMYASEKPRSPIKHSRNQNASFRTRISAVRSPYFVGLSGNWYTWFFVTTRSCPLSIFRIILRVRKHPTDPAPPIHVRDGRVFR